MLNLWALASRSSAKARDGQALKTHHPLPRGTVRERLRERLHSARVFDPLIRRPLDAGEGERPELSQEWPPARPVGEQRRVAYHDLKDKMKDVEGHDVNMVVTWGFPEDR